MVDRGLQHTRTAIFFIGATSIASLVFWFNERVASLSDVTQVDAIVITATAEPNPTFCRPRGRMVRHDYMLQLPSRVATPASYSECRWNTEGRAPFPAGSKVAAAVTARGRILGIAREDKKLDLAAAVDGANKKARLLLDMGLFGLVVSALIYWLDRRARRRDRLEDFAR